MARSDQPTFAPGSTTATTGGGKGDAGTGALAPGGLSGAGTTTRPTANPLATNSTGMNGFGLPGATNTGTTTGTNPGATSGTAVANRTGPTPTGSPSPSGTLPSTSTSPSTSPSTSTGSTTEQTYVVKKGDSLSTIAQQFYGSAKEWKRIANANPLVDPNLMKVGAKLRIPAKTDGGTPAVASAETTTPTTAAGSAGGSQSHTVASGDTLSSISSKYYGSGKHWNKIYASNKSVIGTDPGNLKVGQKLTIPSRTTVVGAETVER